MEPVVCVCVCVCVRVGSCMLHGQLECPILVFVFCICDTVIEHSENNIPQLEMQIQSLSAACDRICDSSYYVIINTTKQSYLAFFERS